MADNGIIQQYAAHLEHKASGLLIRWTLALGFLGGLLGAFPFLHISHGVVSGNLGLGTMLLGALAGAYLGYSTGQKKAIEPRMQAQLALHQLQVEQSLIGRIAVPAAPAQPLALPVAAAPAPAPAVAAPAAPAPAPAAAPAPALIQPAVLAPAPAASAPAAPAQAGSAPPVAPAPPVVAPAAPAQAPVTPVAPPLLHASPLPHEPQAAPPLSSAG